MIRWIRVWSRRSRREMRRAARATSPSRTAFATSCWRKESFSKTRRAARDGDENSAQCPVPRAQSLRDVHDLLGTGHWARGTMISYLQGTVKTLEANRATVL